MATRRLFAQRDVLNANVPIVKASHEKKLPTHGLSRWWLGLLLAAVAVRGAWLAVDCNPMLFLGDSESYLYTALTGWIPPDRSFVYGLAVRLIGVWTHSLRTVLAFQAACSVTSALLLAVAIRAAVGERPWLAAGLAMVWVAAEPLALFWERYVMAESCALPLFAAFVVCGMRYLAVRRLGWLFLANLAGISVVMFRLSFVGVAWLGAFALPLLAWAGGLYFGRFLAHMLASIVIAIGLHGGYQMFYGALTDGGAAYQRADGEFLLAAWAPLLEPDDFPDPELGQRVLDSSNCALRDRRSREMQRWGPNCLVSRLEGVAGQDAYDMARRAAFAALRRDPVGVAKLALSSWLDYFDVAAVSVAARVERGGMDYGSRVNALLLTAFGVDGTKWPRLMTPTNCLYLMSVPWFVLMAASPLVASLAWVLQALRCRQLGIEGAWVALLTFAIMATTALAGTSPWPRYLHPLGWLAPIWIAELLAVLRVHARR